MIYYFLSRPFKLGHAKIVEILIKNGANINRQDPMGQTPLHLAVKSGNSNIQMYTLAHLKLMEKWIEMLMTDWFLNRKWEKCKTIDGKWGNR